MKQSKGKSFLHNFLALALLLTATHSAFAAPHLSPDSSEALDKQIDATLVSLADGDIQQARVLARQMSWRFPKYSLAHLLSAELETTAAFQDVRAGELNPISQRLIDLLSEAQTRLKSARSTETASDTTNSQDLSVLPNNVIQLGKNVSSLLIVDLEQSTINHIVGDDLTPTLIRQHYVSSGKGGFGKQVEGDNKTPLGVYTINAKKEDSSLPDLYGSGALTLDYPNALDRHLGRTGFGIWIHGVPHSQRSRAPRSSEGCVTMSNDHLLSLMDQVTPADTLVILSRGLSYSSTAERLRIQQHYQGIFTHFQDTLLSGDQSQIAKLYDPIRSLRARHSLDSIEQHIATINARDITIVLNPELPTNYRKEASRFLVMKGNFGTENELQFTLYWRELSNGEWRIATEVWSNPKT